MPAEQYQAVMGDSSRGSHTSMSRPTKGSSHHGLGGNKKEASKKTTDKEKTSHKENMSEKASISEDTNMANKKSVFDNMVSDKEKIPDKKESSIKPKASDKSGIGKNLSDKEKMSDKMETSGKEKISDKEEAIVESKTSDKKGFGKKVSALSEKLQASKPVSDIKIYWRNRLPNNYFRVNTAQLKGPHLSDRFPLDMTIVRKDLEEMFSHEHLSTYVTLGLAALKTLPTRETRILSTHKYFVGVETILALCIYLMKSLSQSKGSRGVGLAGHNMWARHKKTLSERYLKSMGTKPYRPSPLRQEMKVEEVARSSVDNTGSSTSDLALCSGPGKETEIDLGPPVKDQLSRIKRTYFRYQLVGNVRSQARVELEQDALLRAARAQNQSLKDALYSECYLHLKATCSKKPSRKDKGLMKKKGLKVKELNQAERLKQLKSRLY